MPKSDTQTREIFADYIATKHCTKLVITLVTDGVELAIELYAHVYSYNYVWEAAVREELSCECELRNTSQ